MFAETSPFVVQLEPRILYCSFIAPQNSERCQIQARECTSHGQGIPTGRDGTNVLRTVHWVPIYDIRRVLIVHVIAYFN